MSLLKAIALSGSAAFYAVAITPPQPPVQTKAVYKGQAYEYIVRYIAYTAGVRLFMRPSSSMLTALLRIP